MTLSIALDEVAGATDNGVMTSYVPRLPVSLDALIAEAKRRARQRRLLLAVIGMVAAAGAVIGGTVAFRNSAPPRPAVVVAAPACRTDQLHLSLTSGGVAGGTAGQELTLRNTSGTACSMHGWPRFRFVMRDGRVVTPHPHELPTFTGYRVDAPPQIPHIVLKPGGTTPVSVNEADGTGYQHPCQLTRTVLVVPPGAQAALPLSLRLYYCGPREMWVLPVGRVR